MAQRKLYTEGQLDQYFDRVAFPKANRIFSVSSLSDEEKLEYLNLVQKHQLVKVPWENLTQHYSWHHVVHVDPVHLFKKIIAPGNNTNRGGYCMEANSFFHTVLLSLGFDVYMAGSRIYHPDTKTYGGWTHVINLVTIAGTKYLLDGGFGANGPSRPVPLHHGVELTQIAPAQMRLMHEPISQNLDRSQKIWKYEFRYDEHSEWVPMYCFVELEFLPEDIVGMNMEPWLNPHTMFTHKVVAVRFTTDREVDKGDGPGSPSEQALEGEVDGSLTVNHDVLKWRKRGKKVVEVPFKTEQDRLGALKRYFGITFEEEDIAGIRGTAAAIGASALGVSD